MLRSADLIDNKHEVSPSQLMINNNEEANTDEQRSLLSLVAIKGQVLLELDERRSTDRESIDKEELWDAIIDAMGGYLGQAQQDLPPKTA